MPHAATNPSGREDTNIQPDSGRSSPESSALLEPGDLRLEAARHFCVEDLPGATIPGARLQVILEALRRAKSVTRFSLEFMRQQGLDALHRYAIGALPYERFRELALAEQAVRIEATTAAGQAKEAAERERIAAMQAKADLFFQRREAARLARERDPRYIARVKSRELRARYGLRGFVEPDCFGRLMAILNRVDAGRRVCAEDYAWLATVGERYFSQELRTAYHRIEAAFCRSEYERTSDPWMAINASSHLRKCGEACEADALLSIASMKLPPSTRLESALATTWGGVMRDLQRRSEGVRLGERAHALTPDDFRPCTLLGAIHMENGDYDLGRDWYAKAVDRGATVDSVDQDLRSVFFRADRDKQAALSAFLLADDPVRYAWVRAPAKSAKSGGLTVPANKQRQVGNAPNGGPGKRKRVTPRSRVS